APSPPAFAPTEPSKEVETAPPSSILSLPVPEEPTESEPLLVQVEPAPFTSTSPLLRAVAPTAPLVFETSPPAEIVSEPVPRAPIDKLLLLVQAEPAPVTVNAAS